VCAVWTILASTGLTRIKPETLKKTTLSRFNAAVNILLLLLSAVNDLSGF
jgi:hypothetical protein